MNQKLPGYLGKVRVSVIIAVTQEGGGADERACCFPGLV